MGIVRTWDISELPKAIQESGCWSDVCRKLGRPPGGSSQQTVIRWAKKLELNYDHFEPIKERTRNRIRKKKEKLVFSEIFCENSLVTRGKIKSLILQFNFFPYKCFNEKCSIIDEWLGSKIVLHLDHINGINNDHRIENLRFLCPNCHSQTETYSGRNKTIVEFVEKIDKRYGPKPNRRKVKRPTKEVLKILITKHNWTELGRKYSVSDNAVRKWAKEYNLI